PAVMFGPLLCVYLLLFEERIAGPDLLSGKGWKAVGRVVRTGLPAVILGVALFLFMESMNGPAATYGGGGRLEYLQTQAFVWLHYARLFFVPAGPTAATDWTLIPHCDTPS